MVVPGATVNVGPGVYTESIDMTASGTAGKRIKFVSTEKWGAVLRPVAATTDTMWRVRGGYVDIDGFRINGTDSPGSIIRQGIYMSGGNSSVRNCWVHNVAENSGCDGSGGAGILADQYLGAQFNNYDFISNLVHDIGGTCDWIQGIYHSSSGSIKNNVVYACNYALHMAHDNHDIEVSNNTVFANRWYGIVYGGCEEAYTSVCPTSGINIQNNIVYDNFGGVTGANTAVDTGTNWIKNNLIFGNTTNVNMSAHGLSQISGTVAADPLFVNYKRDGTGDYRLAPGSPAIGAGLSTIAPATDFAGVARSAPPSIGAYEYVVASQALLTESGETLTTEAGETITYE